MPKRPCALVLADSTSTILVADKFGDVYSLPLLPADQPKLPPKKTGEKPKKTYQPSASTLTVHSKKNLRSLEQQMRHVNTQVAEKDVPEFEYQLLLGHVSMLTDLLHVSLQSSEGRRHYILTADRDEHIRVSRGFPQAHIIEGYCLGHSSFVSSLCVPQWDERMLISGGGDGRILVWDWPEYRLLQDIKLDDQGTTEASQLTVSGTQAVSFEADADLLGRGQGAILIALEG
jgi:tRNA (guanine-N(7)-)-methyltransferase subunit TRM82